MIVSSWDEFWWSNITGPYVMVSTVASALLENANVLIRVPSDLPWRHSMRSVIQSEFRDRSLSRDIIIESVDETDDNPENLDPGVFILNRFADEITRQGYRSKAKKTIQDYIVQRDILRNRIVWVKGLSEKTTEKWIQFCKGFVPMGPEHGLFVLEVHDSVSLQESKTFKIVEYGRYVSSYDVQLLNSFILDSESSCSDEWKRYISTVIATVCGTDAEVSESLLSTYDFTRTNVNQALDELIQMPAFIRRGAEASSTHILKYARNKRWSEINHRIWSAQVQTLFPLIELERIELISKHQEEIQEALDQEATYQYGEELTDPIEVELGTMCYLMARRRSDYLYSLYIPDESDRERIHFLHECRNRLAHAETCTVEQVSALLEK